MISYFRFKNLSNPIIRSFSFFRNSFICCRYFLKPICIRFLMINTLFMRCSKFSTAKRLVKSQIIYYPSMSFSWPIKMMVSLLKLQYYLANSATFSLIVVKSNELKSEKTSVRLGLEIKYPKKQIMNEIKPSFLNKQFHFGVTQSSELQVRLKSGKSLLIKADILVANSGSLAVFGKTSVKSNNKNNLFKFNGTT